MEQRKLTHEELQKKLQRVLNADKQSGRVIFSTDEDMEEFIRNCERVYRKSTEQHLAEHEARGYEGNVDERKWYRFAKQLQEKGKLNFPF